MAKSLYEVKLVRSIIPANSAEEALEAFAEESEVPIEEVATASEVVIEEHTQKLFTLVKMMQDSEQFDYIEIRAALLALLNSLNYYGKAEDIAECILVWSERFDDFTLQDLQDWMFS